MNPSYTLGAPTSTFGPSLRITVVFGAAGLCLCLLVFFATYELNERIAWIVCFALAPILAALAVWQLSFRAAVHERGISCRNIFFSKEWPWNEIERVYYSTTELRFDFWTHGLAEIPLGEFYRLKLHNVYGHVLSFTNHFDRYEELSITVAQCTFQGLSEKALHAFNSGSPVEFGAVTISRADGVTLKRLFFRQSIPWQNILKYQFDDSSITFCLCKGLFKAPAVAARRVANLHVLKFLLGHPVR
jgi:hypothetical protein